MQITESLFLAYCECPYKAFLKTNEATPQTDEPCRMDFSIAVLSGVWWCSRHDGYMNIAWLRCFSASGIPEPRSSIPTAALQRRAVSETSRHSARFYGEGVFVDSKPNLTQTL